MADLPDASAQDLPIQYLSIGDFATLAALSPRTVRRLINEGRLPAMVDDQHTLAPYQPGQLLPPAFRYVLDPAQVEEAQWLATKPSPRAIRQAESGVAPQAAQVAQEAQEAREAEIARLQEQLAEQAAILADRDVQLTELRVREASLEATATAQAGEIQRLMHITDRIMPLLPPAPQVQATSPPPAEPARRRGFFGLFARKAQEVRS